MIMDVFGGCEGNKLAMGVSVVLLLASLLVIWYVYMFLIDSGILKENVCGGRDQLCPCDGNETMVASKNVVPVTNNDLSMVLMGK